MPLHEGNPRRMPLPESGLTPVQLREELQALHVDDADWRRGRTWSLVYSADDPEHQAVLLDAHAAYANENGLSPSAFPSLARMEAEVVEMMLSHLGADPATAAGTMASGGTESIILAVKAYRDRSGVATPSLVMPSTAHPAFVKAAQLLGVEARVVPVSDELVADVDAMAEAADGTTILLIGSAPAYPYGLVDPIPDLADVASAAGIGLHIDACLGGVALPFLRDLGRPVAPFDFAVSGVTSMSVDLHKYGYGPKGTSTVLYRDPALRRHQFTVYVDWPGGALASPTLLGTRSGGAIAAAWAGLRHLGRAGYRRLFEGIMDTTDQLRAGIEAIGDLRVLGAPPMSVFAVASATRDVFAMADALESRGWRIDRQANPDCLHHIVNPTHAPVVEEYLDDLGAAWESAPAADPTVERAAVYGVTARVDAAGDVAATILTDLEARYQTSGGGPS